MEYRCICGKMLPGQVSFAAHKSTCPVMNMSSPPTAVLSAADYRPWLNLDDAPVADGKRTELQIRYEQFTSRIKNLTSQIESLKAENKALKDGFVVKPVDHPRLCDTCTPFFETEREFYREQIRCHTSTIATLLKEIGRLEKSRTI